MESVFHKLTKVDNIGRVNKLSAAGYDTSSNDDKLDLDMAMTMEGCTM